MRVKYKAACYDAFIKVMSYGTTALFSASCAFVIYVSAPQAPFDLQPMPVPVSILVCAILMGIVGMSYLRSVRSYSVDLQKRELIVHRVMGQKVFSLGTLIEGRNVQVADMERLSRVFGNGGLFSYSGVFRSPALGSFRMYSTNSRKNVLVRARDAVVVVSPDDQDGFIETLKSMSSSHDPNIPAPTT
jgi:hypothetical protein